LMPTFNNIDLALTAILDKVLNDQAAPQKIWEFGDSTNPKIRLYVRNDDTGTRKQLILTYNASAIGNTTWSTDDAGPGAGGDEPTLLFLRLFDPVFPAVEVVRYPAPLDQGGGTQWDEDSNSTRQAIRIDTPNNTVDLTHTVSIISTGELRGAITTTGVAGGGVTPGTGTPEIDSSVGSCTWRSRFLATPYSVTVPGTCDLVNTNAGTPAVKTALADSLDGAVVETPHGSPTAKSVWGVTVTAVASGP
jgi:hypothetical protein